MALRIIPKSQQAYGAFNGGQIIENKPVGFPQDGGFVRPYSSMFYWARAEAVIDSTIGLHPHQGFEIMSFVLKGGIRHYDTKTKEWKPLHAGDVQIIRAGSGIQHAEHMEKGAVIFQIWMDPDISKTLKQPATYDDYDESLFPVSTYGGNEERVLIGEGSPLSLDTSPIRITRHKITEDLKLDIDPQNMASLYVISGTGMVDGQTIEQDDFLITEEESVITINPDVEMDLFVIELARTLPYRTYAERAAQLN